MTGAKISSQSFLMLNQQ